MCSCEVTTIPMLRNIKPQGQGFLKGGVPEDQLAREEAGGVLGFTRERTSRMLQKRGVAH